jgi:DNA polymerase I-like protein with 3'-5' exonuclease and polymerase domains
MIRQANQIGCVDTMPDKSVDPEKGYPLLIRRAWGGKAMPTLPLNYHVQGTACWIMNRAMVKVQDYLDKLNSELPRSEYFMIMNVHDELVFDFPRKPRRGNLGIIRHIQGLMESIGEDIGVPLTCESVLHTKNWSEGVVV